uniref:Uncharacterized protein n=1 Tax=Panthera leo TaxID=9689 RepID=A0A8C8XTN6_PANLE
GSRLGLPVQLPLPFQVKQIMEEAATRKFVHEDNSHIISFCGESVDPDLERGFFLCGLPWGSGVFVQGFSHRVLTL